MLITEPVSKAQARQRAGRAGRECPGTCYRLYTEESFKSLAESSVPEIRRSNLASVILNLLAMGIPSISKFDFMDPPDDDAIENALQDLILLGAVDSAENEKVWHSCNVLMLSVKTFYFVICQFDVIPFLIMANRRLFEAMLTVRKSLII